MDGPGNTMANGSVPPKVYAVVPAAGQSRRMGEPKLVLKLGSRTVLEHVVSKIHACPSIAQILVVLGPQSVTLKERLAHSVLSVLLQEQTADMRQTVEAGVQFLESTFHPHDGDGLLLALGDHPSIRSEVVQKMIDTFVLSPGRIVIPTFQGKRGHPLLLPMDVVGQLPAVPRDRGVNELLKMHPDRISEIAFSFDDLLEDMDTPSDYARLRRREWS